jgi:hypothetical protein
LIRARGNLPVNLKIYGSDLRGRELDFLLDFLLGKDTSIFSQSHPQSNYIDGKNIPPFNSDS